MIREAVSFYHGASLAYHAYEQIHAGRHIPASFAAFKAAPTPQTAWTLGGNVVGVLGTERVIRALVTYGVKLALKSRKVDADAGNEMVAAMKASVPVDSGRLLNGITVTDEDGLITVEASGVNPRDDWDYARVVEFGRHAGGAVADESFFADGSQAGAGAARRRPSRGRSGGRGEDPQPFFWPNAREVLATRDLKVSDVADQAAREEGF